MPAPGAAEVSPLCKGFKCLVKQGLRVVEKIFQNFYQKLRPCVDCQNQLHFIFSKCSTDSLL